MMKHVETIRAMETKMEVREYLMKLKKAELVEIYEMHPGCEAMKSWGKAKLVEMIVDIFKGFPDFTGMVKTREW